MERYEIVNEIQIFGEDEATFGPSTLFLNANSLQVIGSYSKIRINVGEGVVQHQSCR